MKDVGELLATYRKKAGFKQLQLAEELKKNGVEIGYRSISTWEKNVCEPSVTVFLNICKILKVPDVIEAYFGENTYNPMKNLNEDGRKKVMEYISLLEGYNNGKYLKEAPVAYEPLNASSQIIDFADKKTSFIRIYENRVSAGLGNFLENDTYEEVDRKEYNVPADADFGVRITGNSMQPRYINGQIVWVHHQETLEEGQIGIFELNGECFCKQLHYDDHQAQLISLNKEYAPRPVREGDTFRTFGRVLS
ncbi:Peptidase S24-like [Lachnospiraceae bacterium KH1T2]|nr:Peptidase S24-like [Lachnospiraceae bacterium KH1T2]